MNFILKILVSAIVIIFAAFIVPGVHVNSLGSALLAAIAISFLNAVLKPILIVLTIPITFFTLGLFLLVINTFIILTADYLIDGFEVTGFGSAFVFSLLLSLTVSLLEKFAQNQH